MSAVERRKTKTPILVDRIADFVEKIKSTQKKDGSFDTKKVGQLWDEEVRFHFDNGRTAKTLELYIVKYRYALKDAFGPKTTPLAICNMKKLKERLDTYISRGDYPQKGVANSIEEKIERAEQNTVGRKPRFLLRVSEFISAMNGVNTKEDMQALWDMEMASMGDKAQATVISYITKYRNAIREAFGDQHPMLRIAAGTPQLYDEARKAKMAKIATKHGSLITFENYSEVMRRCRRYLLSSDPLTIGIGLIGTTGRRPFEVFTQAELKPAAYGKGISKWSVLFNGQAKTKQGEGTKFGVTYEIPVLEQSRIVLDAYHRLRDSSDGKLWLGMSVDDFSSDARLPLRDAMIAKFEDVWPKEEPPKPYGLRHLYAEIAYRNFAPSSVTKNSYFAAILGHNNNDLETSLSYMTYTFPEDAMESKARAERVADRTIRQMLSVNQIPGMVGE
ncbi:telomere resolvase [Agrobacterium larrymoorei]|uniref:Telomere resolvase n=2 Tax=Agrobacterium larrymoorei TaxID=160699 RepID=A0AAF0HB73_9HYPH|nr:telomere resolvase [Agrobacterium larrymoorei]WHA43246.1 telomere resolvase [Agrobacterium larrymoorei]